MVCRLQLFAPKRREKWRKGKSCQKTNRQGSARTAPEIGPNIFKHGYTNRSSQLGIEEPVIVNILCLHALMAPSGFPLALFVVALWALVLGDVRPAFAGLFQSQLHVRA